MASVAILSSYKNGAKLLFIGQNGSGKSSLINELIGYNVASVGNNIEPNSLTDLVISYEITVEGVPDEYVSYFDTRGFGDLTEKDRKITDKIHSTMKTADIVLICYRLYGRVDRYVTDELKEMAQILGDELMKHTILVFTWGDEYKIHCQTSSQEEIKRQMNTLISRKQAKIREVLKKNGIKDEIADNIPYCVTSIKEDKLPCTAEENWKIEFWRKCKNRCTPESVPFMKPLDRSKRHNYKKIAVIEGAVGTAGGVCVGAVFGALIGTIIPIPVVGTAIGASIGAAIGAAISSAVKQLQD